MVRARFFSVISIFLTVMVFFRTTLYAVSKGSEMLSSVEIQEYQEESSHNQEQELVYETNPILEDSSNIASFNQKKYSCSDDKEDCSGNKEDVPCKACAVASGINCGVSMCTFGIAVVAMVIAALVIANAGENSHSH